MWTYSQYTDENNGIHSLQRDGISTLQFDLVGETIPTTAHVDCIGGIYKARGKTYNNVVVGINLEIHLLTRKVEEDENKGLVLVESSTLLPCKADSYRCNAAGETFIWGEERPTSACRLYHIRRTSGIDVTDSEGRRAFMAQDGTTLRILRQEASSMCGEVVYSTNWPKLYLSHSTEKAEFNRPIHPGEVSIRANAAVSNDFSYHKSASLITSAFKALLKQDCNARGHSDDHNYGVRAAAQKATADGESAALGAGEFVTASGDAWYKYQCRAITAQAIPTDLCYDALPVQLTKQDLRAFAKQKNKTSEEVGQLFIQAGTHVLTSVATPMPCTEIFAPAYRNSRGDWITHGKILRTVAPPAATPFVVKEQALMYIPSYDSYADGLYPGEMLDKAESWRQQGEITRAVNVKIAAQIHRDDLQQQSFSASQLFHELPQQDGYWTVLNGLWGIANMLGAFGAKLMAVGFIWFGISSLIGAGQRLWIAFQNEGCGTHICYALCPAGFFYRMLGLATAKNENAAFIQGLTEEGLRKIITEAVDKAVYEALTQANAALTKQPAHYPDLRLELAAGTEEAKEASAPDASISIDTTRNPYM
jgi:hypothetical protein